MLKILIETTLNDLLIVLLQNDLVLDSVHMQNLQYKSEALPLKFLELLKKHDFQTSQIQAFYVTLGPGSFMGSRVGLIFVRTICQVTNARLFTSDTLTFIANNQNGTYFIDAKSSQSYQGVIQDGKIVITLQSFQPNSIVDYEAILKNLPTNLQFFKLASNLLEVSPFYFKKPRVGG